MGAVSSLVGIADQLHFDGEGEETHFAFGGEDGKAPLNSKCKAGAIRKRHAVWLATLGDAIPRERKISTRGKPRLEPAKP